MKISSPLQKGTLIKRYKRFLVDITIDNQPLTAHCPNSGSMKGLLEPGNPIWISTSSQKNRKLPYTLEFIETDAGLVGVNTQHPNKIVREALEKQEIPEFSDYSEIQQEALYKKGCRFDFCLRGDSLPHVYIEVKNVTLKENNTALFPDAITERGTKHLKELIEIKKQGHRAAMIYLIQREDCSFFDIAHHIDKTYSKMFYEAKNAGVEILVYQCKITPPSIKLDKRVELRLSSAP